MLPGLAAQTVSPFPNPPEYAQQYTSDRIDNVSTGSAPLPPHPHTEFCVFGEEYRLEDDVVAPLGNAGVRELYANKNHWKAEMKKLNRSAIIAFFDLVEVLIRAPDHPFREEKMNDLHTIFINMHHLINEFRPVQARDSVRILQERQIEELDNQSEHLHYMIFFSRKYLKDGREVVEDQFGNITRKLEKPPVPAELSGVALQDGLLHALIEKKVKVAEESEEGGQSESLTQKNVHIKSFISREEGPPSVTHLSIGAISEFS
uniref:Mediator of RNA polymerase II transcription subunit 7 n=1 Tax=Caenorhabditis japonica TaxID=281687 RepID=A0A8R1HIJ0_CAEJA